MVIILTPSRQISEAWQKRAILEEDGEGLAVPRKIYVYSKQGLAIKKGAQLLT